MAGSTRVMEQCFSLALSRILSHTPPFEKQSFQHQSVLFSDQLAFEPRSEATLALAGKKNCWKSCHTASVQFVICIHISSEYKSSTRRDYYSQPSAARFQMSIFIMIFETEKLPSESSEMFHPQLHFLLRKFPPCLSPASVPFPFLPFSVNNFFSGAILDFSLALFRIKLSRLSEKQL